MSNSNTTVNITSDGSVVTYNEYNVRNYDLSGTLPVLHEILRLNRLSGNDKRKVPDKFRIRHARFYFIREDTSEVIELPLQHVMELVKYIKNDNSVTEFVNNLLLQIPTDK